MSGAKLTRTHTDCELTERLYQRQLAEATARAEKAERERDNLNGRLERVEGVLRLVQRERDEAWATIERVKALLPAIRESMYGQDAVADELEAALKE